MADQRRYNDDDIQAIIQRALEQSAAKGDLTHADLVGIGEQVGVSQDALERAARELIEGRRAAEATTRVKSSRRRWLAAHTAVFMLINALLFTVNALTTPGEWWFLFSLVFWGLALSGHAGFAIGAGVSLKRREKERALIEAEARAQLRPQLRVSEAPSETVASDQAETASREAERRAGVLKP